METAAKVTSKGQLTLPKTVRDALGIRAGDEVIFRVEGQHAVLARTPELLGLAGSVPVPASKRGATWPEIRQSVRKERAGRQQ